jgi:magnesium-protoporphyrin IX monomethyl ester (oxidative) cyclase
MCDILFIHAPGPPTTLFLPFPPLGIGYLASVLEKKGFDVKIIDLNVETLDKSKFKKIIKLHNPKIVGISSTSLSIPYALEVAKTIKSILDVPIVLGGAHATVDPAFVYKFSDYFDYQVIGEGEITFPSIAKELLRKKRLKRKVYKGIPVSNLDSIPFPAYHLLPMTKYVKFAAPMIISRGCPYACTFCRPHEKIVRFRSVDNIIDEIKFLREKYNIHIIEFEDDNFTLNKKLVKKLCEKIIEEKLEIEWSCQTRVNLVDFHLLQLMKRAGCKFITFGLETFSPYLQGIINKNLSLKDMILVLRLTKKVGMKVGVNCIFGIPEEREKDINLTLWYLNKLKPDHIFFSVLVPFPQTVVFDSLVKKKKIEKDIWDKYANKIEAPPISLSENFSPILYFSYFTKIASYSRIGIYIPKFFSILQFLKLFTSLRRFVYRNEKIFYYIERFSLNTFAKVRFLQL